MALRPGELNYGPETTKIQFQEDPRFLCQVASGSASLPDPVALETEEQRLEREQNDKFSTGWAVGVVKSAEKKRSVASQFAVKHKSEMY